MPAHNIWRGNSSKRGLAATRNFVVRQMITILSDNGRFKAVLDDTEGDIAVTFWRSTTGPTSDRPVWKLISRQTVDLAFHVACDLAHDTVNELKILPPPAQSGRACFPSSSAEPSPGEMQ
jgi:hypothetical protein